MRCPDSRAIRTKVSVIAGLEVRQFLASQPRHRLLRLLRQRRLSRRLRHRPHPRRQIIRPAAQHTCHVCRVGRPAHQFGDALVADHFSTTPCQMVVDNSDSMAFQTKFTASSSTLCGRSRSYHMLSLPPSAMR